MTTKTKAKKAKTKAKTSKTKAKSKSKKTSLRTPIVAVVGHVDHGKTSLLDALKGTQVQEGEAGGITQNTRAHKINNEEVVKRLDPDASDKTKKKKTKKQDHHISTKYTTFIDTPGHEAFSNMRSRGAKVADIALLVVAADDGVQPQTKESIKFIKDSKIPVVVACNKMDLPGANPDQVKNQLSSEGILIEEYGGEAIFVKVSAHKKEGLIELIEAISLTAEVNELKETKPAQSEAEAFVLESQLDPNLGAVSLVILKAGQIKKGQFLVEAKGDIIHKIRATLNEEQQEVETTEQGDPVWLIGLEDTIDAGQNILVFNKQEEAKKLLKEKHVKETQQSESIEEALDDTELFANLLAKKQEKEEVETTLKVILKADSIGTLEAIEEKLEDLSFDDAKVEIYSAETGKISESDVMTAKTISGIILGFQVDFLPKTQEIARKEKVLIRNYEIIYDLINEVEDVVKSMQNPEEEVIEIARAKVKQVFTLSDGTFVAGSEVTFGNVLKGYNVYVERNGEEISEGKITSLKHFKEEVREAKKGTECGIIIEPQFELEEGDEIVCFKVE